MRASLTRVLDKVPAPLAARMQNDAAVTRLARKVVNRVVPDELTVVHVRSGPAAGAAVEIFPREEKYYWTGLHEPHVQESIAELLQPGDVFWDIGSHIGFMSILASRAVGDAGSVLAFEPIEENRERLLRNVKLNGLRNVGVEPVAMSDRPGEFVLNSQGSSLMWTLAKTADESHGVRVQCNTIDLVLRDRPVPALVKIDAEKAELDVLKGGLDLIAKRTTTFIVEFMDDDLLGRAQRMMVGYRFESLGANHWVIRPE